MLLNQGQIDHLVTCVRKFKGMFHTHPLFQDRVFFVLGWGCLVTLPKTVMLQLFL